MIGKDSCSYYERLIGEDQIKCVALDFIDVLATLPFYDPNHLFYLLDSMYEQYEYSCVCFHQIRTRIEECLKHSNNSFFPYVSIEKIYEKINSNCGIPYAICNELAKYEEKLFSQYCRIRESMKTLCNRIIHNGKRVIVIANCSYHLDLVKKILLEQGISPEVDVVSVLNRTPEAIAKAIETKLSSCQIMPGRLAYFCSEGGETYSGAFINSVYLNISVPKTCTYISNHVTQKSIGEIIAVDNLKQSFGFGCLAAVAANKYFDDPFEVRGNCRFARENPYMLGYCFLGMYLVGILKWIIKETKEYKRVLFSARDGYLVMKAFESVSSYCSGLPEAKYLHISRKLMMPYIINTLADVAFFPSLDRMRVTPCRLGEMLSFCLSIQKSEYIAAICKRMGINENQVFGSEKEYMEFVEYLWNTAYDKTRHENAKKLISDYFSDVNETDVVFDLGNYGRVHSAFVRATQKNIAALFLFKDKDICYREESKNGFKVKTMFSYYPRSYRSFREYILSERGPSCVGVQAVDDGTYKLLWEEGAYNDNDTRDVKKKIHAGALQYVADIMDMFGDKWDEFDFAPQEVAIPFEIFLGVPQQCDLEMFKGIKFERTIQEDSKDIPSTIYTLYC